jgi:hypothetical protein
LAALAPAERFDCFAVGGGSLDLGAPLLDRLELTGIVLLLVAALKAGRGIQLVPGRWPLARSALRPAARSWLAPSLRRTFRREAEAKTWRADAQRALDRGVLRAPKPTTVSEAWKAWYAGAKTGAITNRSGDPYKPSAPRSYEQAMRLRVLPAFGKNTARRLAAPRPTEIHQRPRSRRQEPLHNPGHLASSASPFSAERSARESWWSTPARALNSQPSEGVVSATPTQGSGSVACRSPPARPTHLGHRHVRRFETRGAASPAGRRR